MIAAFRELRLTLEVPDAWAPVEDEDAQRWRHASGLELVARWREGERARLEVDVLPAPEIATAPAPRLRLASERPLIAWLGGASGEIVAPGDDGPIIATQRRGYASGEAETVGLFPEPLVVAPGHPASSVWVFEHFDGDLLDAPPEPRWLPPRRHVPLGDEIELLLPDSVVTGIEATESDEGFELHGEPGLATAHIGGPTGITQLELGWFMDWQELIASARERADGALWCYLTTLLNEEVDIDELDVRLAAALEEPDVWAALAAERAVGLGLPLHDDALRAAHAVAGDADVATRIALITRGLLEVSSLVGVALGREACAGLQRFGLGRVMTGYPDGAERELASAWFWMAGLGDSPLAARVGSIVSLVQARALSRASETLEPEAVAWLSLFA